MLEVRVGELSLAVDVSRDRWPSPFMATVQPRPGPQTKTPPTLGLRPARNLAPNLLSPTEVGAEVSGE